MSMHFLNLYQRCIIKQISLVILFCALYVSTAHADHTAARPIQAGDTGSLSGSSFSNQSNGKIYSSTNSYESARDLANTIARTTGGIPQVNPLRDLNTNQIVGFVPTTRPRTVRGDRGSSASAGLSVRRSGTSNWGNDIFIANDERYDLRYSGSGGCRLRSNGNLVRKSPNGSSGFNDTHKRIGLNRSGKYRHYYVAPGHTTIISLKCFAARGDSPTRLVAVTRQGSPPSVTLTSRKTGQSSWQNVNSVSLAYTDQLDLRMQSQRATVCSKESFSLSGVNGTANNVPLPADGGSRTYRVICTGLGGSVTDSVTANRATPPPTAMLRVRSTSNASWRNTDSISADFNDTIDLQWSSAHATRCVGSGFSTGNRSGGTLSGASLPSAGGSRTYLVTCTGPGGTATDRVIVNRLNKPNLTLSSLEIAPSDTFDKTTGIYQSVAFSTRVLNNGESRAARSDYRIRSTDISRSISITPITGSTILLNPNASAPITFNFTSVPFGVYERVVTADYNDVIDESNESDNERRSTLTVPPPVPDLSLTTPQTIVRNGEAFTINWDTDMTYPMNCTVTGANLSAITFDPSVSGPTGSTVIDGLNAAATYTLTCVEPITNSSNSVDLRIEVIGDLEEI